MFSEQWQALIDSYMDIFWQSAPASGLEAASRQILEVLAGHFPIAYLDDLLTEAREAVASALEHSDMGAHLFFNEKIVLLEQFQAQLAALS